MTGLESLHHELDEMRETLKAFGDPVVAEHAGLRLLRQTLTEREQHIAATIAQAERGRLTLSLDGVAGDGLAIRVLVPLLDGVQGAVTALARRRAQGWPAVTDEHCDAAVALQVTDLDEGHTVTLQRPDGPLAAQLADPETGAPLVELALEALLLALGGDGDGDAPAAPLRRLLGALSAQPLQLSLTLEGVVVESRTVTVTRADALRLYDALSG